MNLNNILKNLKKEFPYIYDNFACFCKINDILLIRLKEERKRTASDFKLSEAEIFNYTETILKIIDSNYYDEFVKAKNMGIIHVDAFNETRGSYLSADGKILNLKYTGSFFDVSTFIHEFIHYLNRITCQGKSPLNRQCFGETMAITFELYSQYLLFNIGISKESLSLNIRYNFEKNMVNYFHPFLEQLKSIFEEMEHNEENDFSKEIPEELTIARKIGSHFQHLLGFVLSYYIINNFDFADILYLNNHLNDFKNIDEILRCLKIDWEILPILAQRIPFELDLKKRKNTEDFSII